MHVFLKKAEKEDMKIIYQMQIEPLVGFACAKDCSGAEGVRKQL